MGLFDDFSDIFAGINELGDELKGLKDDIISSVIQPGQELKDAVGEIANKVTSDPAGAASAITRINVTDGSDVAN